MRRLRMVLMSLTVCLLAALPASAGETTVYGDPGSGDFSVALAVAADAAGNAYVMGSFYGDFQGVTSTGWDLWIARVADDGSFAWLHTWDAPQIEADLAEPAEWLFAYPWRNTRYDLIVDDAGRIRGRVGDGGFSGRDVALVSISLDGSNPSIDYLGLDKMTRPTLMPDGSGDIMGFLIPLGSNSGPLARARSDGSTIWESSVPGDDSQTNLIVTSDGVSVVGHQLPRLSFQNPAVGVTAIDPDGKILWNTEIFDACFSGTPPLIDTVDEVGLTITSPKCGSEETRLVPTLDMNTGQRLTNRVLQDSLNIIWCDDPRLGPITEPIPFGFVDGDECGGDPVWVTNGFPNLIAQASPSEGFAIVGMGMINGGTNVFGVLHTIGESDRWRLDQFDYLGPEPEFVPWDMAITKNGVAVVGRVSNTAWITSDGSTVQAQLDQSSLGAAALVTVNVHAARTFLPDGHTIGLVDPTQGQWHLFDNVGQKQFFFGNPGDYPIMGDWNCNGIETPGMYRQSDGYVYLRNSNTQGPADIKFFFGDPGDIPVAGDFNGDGCGTVSIYRPSNQTFYIINELGENDGGLGAAEFSYVFGDPGDKPFVGDFDGDGEETVGLHRESTGLVYFRNSHTQGNADNQFIFGDPGDRLVAGDWTGNGEFTPALFRPSTTTTYFRFTNTQGNADYQFKQGEAYWLPVAGNE